MERPLSLQPTQGQPFLILNLSGTPRRGLQTPAAMRVEVPLAPGTSSLLLLSYLAAWHIDAVPLPGRASSCSGCLHDDSSSLVDRERFLAPTTCL